MKLEQFPNNQPHRRLASFVLQNHAAAQEGYAALSVDCNGATQEALSIGFLCPVARLISVRLVIYCRCPGVPNLPLLIGLDLASTSLNLGMLCWTRVVSCGSQGRLPAEIE